MIVPNIAANAVSMAVTIVAQMGLSFAAYRLVGAEHYGLIGLFATVMTAAAVFDTGLSLAMIRETARRRDADAASPDGVRQLLFNFFFLYLAIAVALALGIGLASPWIATGWLKPETIPVDEVILSVALMGLAIAIQRLRGAFQSVLDGMERQVVSGALLTVTSLIRLALGVGAMIVVAPSAPAFFASQILASVIETAAFAIAAQRLMPATTAPVRFDRRTMSDGFKFSLTTASGAAVGTTVQIADSVIVGAVLPLAAFGNYSLVTQMCTALVRLTAPVLNAAYPRIAALVRDGRDADLKRTTFIVSALSTVLLATGSFALVFFGAPLLELVSGSGAVGRDYALVLALMTGAYAFSGLARPLHVVQMAEGFPGIALRINIGLAIFYLPAIAWLTPKYGVVAPAACFFAGTAGSFVVFLATAFRHRLKGHGLAWLTATCLPPIAASAAVYAIGWEFAALAGVTGAIPLTAVAVVLSGVSLGAATLASPDLREMLLGRLRRRPATA